MGVPAFFRWLRDKYTKCIVNVVEEESTEVDGVHVPVNISAANPNGIEFDNMYLDMNGIIHPCVHPEDVPPPETEEEMFLAIFAYIDRLVSSVRPRKLLFMAIDGVAPRAKMNQQRARRFKAAQEIREHEEVEEEMRARLIARGQKPPPKSKATFDHNVITPGTTFMDRLAFFLRYYIHDRINNDAGWRNLRVVLSDASVPGEGEHKVMEWVRQQRSCPGYNPNTRHILHGLDADLIMLGLATHEPHFTILREEVLPPKHGVAGAGPNACFTCGESGHRAASCPNKGQVMKDKEKEKGKGGGEMLPRKPLQFLHLSILREYLHMEFAPLATVPGSPWPMPYDLDRVIDDFVFMCFFVGNDFLPHLPSLDIREGAIDLLMALYKALLPRDLGGYLTHSGHVHLGRACVVLGKVGQLEDEIFKRRRRKEERDKASEAARNAQEAANVRANVASAALDPARVLSLKDQMSGLLAEWKAGAHAEASAPPAKRPHLAGDVEGARPSTFVPPADSSNRNAAAALRASLMGGGGQAVAVQVRHVVVCETGVEAVAAAALPSLFAIPLTLAELSLARSAAVGATRMRLVDDYAVADRQVGTDAPVDMEKAEGETLSLPEATLAGLTADDIGMLLGSGGVEGGVEDPCPAPCEDAPRVGLEDSDLDNGNTGADEDEDEVETLVQAVEDEAGRDLANAIKDMLKGAVKLALDVKHTHDDVVDTVALGTPGWKERYYANKFGKHAIDDAGFVRSVCKDYAAGLLWVFKYYLQGVASWKWFYPHHYAPFASDLAAAMSSMHAAPVSGTSAGGGRTGHASASFTFELGRPFRPLDQLMGVLPALSSHALPRPCHALMTDPASPVHDFYPEIFAQDPNGKKFSWLWVVLLPFIDEGRLVGAMDSVAHLFTADERRRNTLGNELLFVHADTSLGRVLAQLSCTSEESVTASGWTPPPFPPPAPPHAVVEGGTAEDTTHSRPPVQARHPDETALVLNLSDPDEASAAATAAGLGVDPTRVPSPAISPAVTEALACGGRTGRMLTVRPDQGDVESKGVSGRVLPLTVGNKYGWAAPLGGTFKSPSSPRLPDLPGNRVVQVVLLPPVRRAHMCSLLPGLEMPAAKLSPSDDASGVVPRLSRGMSIADLAQQLNRNREEGGYGHGGVYGGAQHGVGGQHPLAAVAQAGGYAGYAQGYAASHGGGGVHHGGGYAGQPQALPQPGGMNTAQRSMLAGMGIKVGLGGLMVQGQGAGYVQHAPPMAQGYSFRPGQGQGYAHQHPPAPPYGYGPPPTGFAVPMHPQAPGYAGVGYMGYGGAGYAGAAPTPQAAAYYGHGHAQGGYGSMAQGGYGQPYGQPYGR